MMIRERRLKMEALQLPKYTIGVGDRFALQGKAQLRACALALESGIEIIPVWNKSNREHLIVGSEPSETRRAADSAVTEMAWPRAYFLDADHIGIQTLDRFIGPCDFFTIDVAHKIGSGAVASDIRQFTERHPELSAETMLKPLGLRFKASRDNLEHVARKYLAAVQEAGKIYRYIADRKGAGKFVPEISMDETDSPQTPLELLIILAAIADEKIPIQTVAPKFTGRFNKGVDYRGDVEGFTREFTADLAVVAHAVRNYNLPANLKLSVHSGSDKFSLYRPIHRAITDAGTGIHLKTAGTTWLAELAGLALAGGEGLEIARDICLQAYEHIDELCAPYASVIEINRGKLPSAEAVKRWSSQEYFAALNHDLSCGAYNSDLRQLLHVSFKIAAKMGERFTGAVKENVELIARGVTENLFERHIRPVFFPD
ncbi:MAG: tagaturonate epimerase family protein [Acidobacteriota bacterium]|nr:tagaturonate epimerase family protein [Acidobacteriota bacterium]